MRLFIFSFAFFIFLLSSECPAGEADYFPKISKEEIPLALEKIKSKNCDEFLDRYLDVDHNDPKTMIQAFAYEVGLCVEQDIVKARDLYDSFFKVAPFSPISPIHLSAIYAFGPEQVKNPLRAEFFMKQSVINLSILRDKQSRLSAAENLWGTQPLPEKFKEYLDWIDVVLNDSIENRKKISSSLSEQGFMNTDFLWHSSDNAPH